MTSLDKQTFNKIIKLLLPICNDIPRRTAFVNSTFFGCAVVEQIEWAGTGRTFAVNLVTKLLEYGQWDDEETIITLLVELKNEFGAGQQQEIDNILSLFQPRKIETPISDSSHEELAKLQDDYSHFSEDENWTAAKYMLDRISQLPNAPQRWLKREYQQIEYANKPNSRPKTETPKPKIVIPKNPKSEYWLPQPFEWCKIPAGKVTLIEDYWEDEGCLRKGQSRTFEIEAFDMAKYPITNAQFALFIKANGYDKQSYWTSDGWEVKSKENWTEPRYWNDTKWNKAEYPVVGVSWYEALAYTKWLSDITDEKICLPTEQQWQRAAQGDDGRVYPWGDEWEVSRCNNSVDRNDVGKITPVTQYSNGVSPYGAFDMSGNVWEWCLTDFETGSQDVYGTNGRVLRGGSWNLNNTNLFRAAFRFRNDPDNWYDNRGFRVSRSYT